MTSRRITIKEWAEDDRPREKLLSKNPSSLSDSELLAILIRNGTHEQSAVELAKAVLRLSGNNLLELGKLPVKDLMKVKGIGAAKAITIAAALELGRRRQAQLPVGKAVVRHSKEVAAFLQANLQDYQEEVFAVIYLNQSGKVLQFEIISRGGLTSTTVDPRVIIRKALEQGAVSLILSHNHPSGNLRPSRLDKDLTVRIRDAARLFDIHLLDHIIVSGEGYFSFADAGLLPATPGP